MCTVLDSCLLILYPLATHYILCPLLIPTHHRITLYKAEEEVVVEAGGDRVGEIESPESLVGTGGIKASDF